MSMLPIWDGVVMNCRVKYPVKWVLKTFSGVSFSLVYSGQGADVKKYPSGFTQCYGGE